MGSARGFLSASTSPSTIARDAAATRSTSHVMLPDSTPPTELPLHAQGGQIPVVRVTLDRPAHTR